MTLKPGVTVFCLAYNHEQFIGQTLQGFLEQKTDFPFHVIIHDDCSTDNTRQIIRQYVAQRPELFTTIFQEENQYSKPGVSILRTFIYPRIETEYTCICEGDDYWTDPMKLQLQYDYLQAHPECSMCVHNTERVDVDGSSLHHPISSETQDRDYTPEDIINSCGNGLFHTSAHMYRTHLRNTMPDYYNIPGVGDFPQSIYFATQGTIHYMARTMSAYRMNVPGSWTSRVEKNRDQFLAHLQDVIGMMQRIDQYTDGKYHATIQNVIERSSYPGYVRYNHFFSILKSKECRKLLRKEPFGFQIKLTVRGFAGPLIKPIKRLMNKN